MQAKSRNALASSRLSPGMTECWDHGGAIGRLASAGGIGFAARAPFLRGGRLRLRAWRLPRPLHLNAREKLMSRHELEDWSIPTCVGLTAWCWLLTLWDTAKVVTRALASPWTPYLLRSAEDSRISVRQHFGETCLCIRTGHVSQSSHRD